MFDPVKFIKETRNELKRVTWPTRQETIKLTQVVIIVSLIVSIFLGLLDFGFNKLLRFVLR